MANSGWGNAVEAWGVPAVMNLVSFHMNENDNANYSLWQGKILKFANTEPDQATGIDKLSKALESLRQSGTSALYTIKFHNIPEAADYISDKTPATGSFNFRLDQDQAPGQQQHYQQQQQVNGVNTQLIDKLDRLIEFNGELAKKVVELENKVNTPPPEPITPPEHPIIAGIYAATDAIESSPMLSGILEDAAFALQRYLKKKFNKPTMEDRPTYGAQQMPPTAAPEQREEGLRQSLVYLLPLVPDLPEMLAAMVQLHQRNQDDFNYLVKKLRNGLNNI